LYIERAIAKKINFGNGCPHLHHLHMQKYTEFIRIYIEVA